MKPFALFVLVVSLVACAAQGVRPLVHAHAHNDYHHDRPLLDALDHGFMSVEADIFLIDGELLVAHDREDVQPGRTLQALYLDPLRERARRYGGRIYPRQPREAPFTLLIDIKNHGEATFIALEKVLETYSDIIASWEPNGDGAQQPPRPVLAIVSGSRPLRTMRGRSRLFGRYDGRMKDLDEHADLPAPFMPLVSDNWFTHFAWAGQTEEMPAHEREKLHALVAKAHAQGRRVRFWMTAENENVWRELRAADVDLINTDQLQKLQIYLN